ncbi:MAG: hypothetical protein P8129_24080, partial [Anaerolineae bacterium]
YTLTGTGFQKALASAQAHYLSPPPYVLMGFNCTTFARDIFRAAGVSFPGSGMRILHKRAWTPGKLYSALEKKTEAYGGRGQVDPLEDVVNQVKTETEKRQIHEIFKLKVAAELRIPYAEVRALTFEDMAVLFALRKRAGRGSELGFSQLLELFEAANEQMSQDTDGDIQISLSFMGQLSEAGRARLTQHLGLSDEELDNLRGGVGETEELETQKLEMIEAIQGLDFSEQELRLLTYTDVMTLRILEDYQGKGGIHAGSLVKAYEAANMALQYLFLLSSRGQTKLAEFLGMRKEELDELLQDQDTLEEEAREEESWAQAKEGVAGELGVTKETLKILSWKDVAVWYALKDYQGRGDQLDDTVVRTQMKAIQQPPELVAGMSSRGITSLADFLGLEADSLRDFLDQVATTVKREKKQVAKESKETAKNILKPKLGAYIVDHALVPVQNLNQSLKGIVGMGMMVLPNIATILKGLTEEEKTAMAQLLQVGVEELNNGLQAL